MHIREDGTGTRLETGTGSWEPWHYRQIAPLFTRCADDSVGESKSVPATAGLMRVARQAAAGSDPPQHRRPSLALAERAAAVTRGCIVTGRSFVFSTASTVEATQRLVQGDQRQGRQDDRGLRRALSRTYSASTRSPTAPAPTSTSQGRAPPMSPTRDPAPGLQREVQRERQPTVFQSVINASGPVSIRKWCTAGLRTQHDPDERDSAGGTGERTRAREPRGRR